MTSQSVLTVGPTGIAHAYSSVRAAARALSGDGTERSRTAIASRVAGGGGYIGNVYVTSGTSYVRP